MGGRAVVAAGRKTVAAGDGERVREGEVERDWNGDGERTGALRVGTGGAYGVPALDHVGEPPAYEPA